MGQVWAVIKKKVMILFICLKQESAVLVKTYSQQSWEAGLGWS